MSEKILKVKYQCQHPSCQVYCKRGQVTVSESDYAELHAFYPEDGIFKSPREICKMGFSQPFKAISVEEAGTENVAEREDVVADPTNDPIEMLKAEHLGVIEKLNTLEAQVRKRDIDGLWVTTAAVEDDIMLHSVNKEEAVLFPHLAARMPMGDAYMQIMHEDHKEFMSLLHSFRCALQEDEILDGIINSVIVNLRNHIKKENEEFFSLAGEYIGMDDKKKLLADMKKLEDDYEHVEAGDRSEKIVSPYLEDRRHLNEGIAKAKHDTCKDGGCH